MNDYCPNCNKECDIEKINTSEIFKVRGDEIEVEVEYYKCNECDIEFEDIDSEIKPIEEAYIKYRAKHNMITPEKITELRKKYNLSQREFSLILGWGGATLSRYENGGLQDDAHDRMLHLIMNPTNILELIKSHPNNLPINKRNQLIKKISFALKDESFFNWFLELLYSFSTPDIYNGYRKTDIDKIKNTILFFCENGNFKTIINKLLFYTDFKHFKEKGVSITGAHYAHGPYGPILDKYESFLASMVEGDRSIKVDEIELPDPEKIVEKYTSIEKPDFDLFVSSEKEVLHFIRDKFKNFGAKEISEFSHKEKGFISTSNGEFISYDFASSLQI